MSLLVYRQDGTTYIRLDDRNQLSFYRSAELEGEGYEPYTMDELKDLDFVTEDLLNADYSILSASDAHEEVKEIIEQITGSNTVEILL